jgi:hypothetical protein
MSPQGSAKDCARRPLVQGFTVGHPKGKSGEVKEKSDDRAAFFWVLFFSAKEKYLASAAKQRAKSIT